MTTMAELAAQHPVRIAGDGHTPLAQLIAARTGLSAADAQTLARRGGAWLGRQRLLDPAWIAPADTPLDLHTPPSGSYDELEISDSDILYRDRWLLALNKRPGWLSVAAPWDVEANIDAALARMRATEGATEPPHLLHRLDRETSGLLLVSLDPAVNAQLAAALERSAVKRYLALAAGTINQQQIELTTGHGRGESGLFRLYPAELIGQRLELQRRPIRAATTTFEVLERFSAATLVQATLHTGRTHQIRLHLRELGHPVLGDRRYHGPAQIAGLELTHQLLHAWRLALTHPVTGQQLALEVPPPPLFGAALEHLHREFDNL